MKKRSIRLFLTAIFTLLFIIPGPANSSPTRIKITRLDYSCWRWQSDSIDPVFIQKRKPVFDLNLKINRCFEGKAGYVDPRFYIIFDYSGGNNTKYKANIDREEWINLKKGCYEVKVSGRAEIAKLSDFVRISCD